MAERTTYKELKKGDTVFFFYDADVPCVLGTIEKIMNRDVNGNIICKIHWLEGGTSNVLYERIFLSKEDCMAYAKEMGGK